MRPKTIASKTEIINFHIASDQKEFLQTYAKKRGEVFSELVRVAIGKYVDELKEEEEIVQLKERSEEFRGAVIDYETSVKHLETLTAQKEQQEYLETIYSKLDRLVETLSLKKFLTARPEKTISSEMHANILWWRIMIIRQYLIFVRKVYATIERTEKILESKEANSAFVEKHELIPKKKKKREEKK